MPVYSVSQVVSYIKSLLQWDGLLQDVWVSGEVGNLSRPGSGHAYFTLRDSDSSLRCVMFRSAIGGERLDGGAAVIAHGRVSIYEVRGDLQLVVDIVQPEGVGELQLRLEQLKLKLQNEGLFEPSRKRPIPAFPRRVGVITSPTGAVWQDIQTVVKRRYPLVELLLAPAPVQGDVAAPGIVEAFEAMNLVPDMDVVILARGGGSLEDLWAFNEEAVARAIFASRHPVISAVGHETDFTIADMVADLRAPTPSAGAEMAVPDRRELASRVLVAEQGLCDSIETHLSTTSDYMAHLRERLGRCCPDLDSLRLRADDLLKTAVTCLKHSLELRAERFEGLRQRLGSLSPHETLRRGYAIVQRRDDGTVVSDAAHLKAGDAVDVTLNKGAFEAEVTSVVSADR
jgi:exodeoxyribonuclease VII large subunit